jgi:CheY-like chemotaxis protein
VGILLVDDEVDLRDLLQMQIELAFPNTPLHTASDGKEAMAVLAKQPISLIVSDVMMPNMDGWELMVEVRKNYPKTKFLVISGNHTHEHAKLAAANGDAMLPKPFRGQDLIDLIRKLA